MAGHHLQLLPHRHGGLRGLHGGLHLPLIAVLALALAEAAWILHANRPALTEGDAWPTVAAILWPTVGAAGLVAGVLWKVPRLGGLARGAIWATPASCALVPLVDPDLGRWLVVPVLLVLAATMTRWRWLGPLSVLGVLSATVRDVPVREVLQPSEGGGEELVVLVTLDTLRADHVGAIGGYPREVMTPQLDALAEEALLFTAGESEVPLTLPSHTAMLTGRGSWEAGVLRNGQVLAEGAETVATRLRAAGWRTGAFLGSHVLHAGTGLDRGFERYDDLMGPAAWQATVPGALIRLGWLERQPFQRSGEVVVERALRWLEGVSGPTFLWVHLYDAHSPYEPPPPYDALYSGEAEDAPGNPEELAAWRDGQPQARLLFRLQPRDVRAPIARYAGEVSWVDELVGRLVAALPSGAALVVAADHGESLSEHGYLLNHGAQLYEPSLHVPILVRAPGVSPGRIAAPTSVRRVGPTLLALAGESPGAPSLLDPPDEELVAYAPGQQARPDLDLMKGWRVAWRRGSEKWIVSTREETLRFDLDADPGELVNLASGEDAGEVTERGRALLERLRSGELGAATDETAEMEEALRALGYVE